VDFWAQKENISLFQRLWDCAAEQAPLHWGRGSSLGRARDNRRAAWLVTDWLAGYQIGNQRASHQKARIL